MVISISIQCRYIHIWDIIFSVVNSSMSRAKGVKNKNGYKMSTKALKVRQTARVTDVTSRNKDRPVVKFLEKHGLLEDPSKDMPRIIEDNLELLKLIKEKALLRQTYIEMYKQMGNVGLELMDDLIEIDTNLMKLRQEYQGREGELVTNKFYIMAMDLKRKLNKDIQKLNLDKGRFISDQIKKRGENDIIDIDVEVLNE